MCVNIYLSYAVYNHELFVMCQASQKLPCLESAWKTPVPGICLVLGRTTKLRLRWQCEHKRVARMKRLGYSRYRKRLYRDNCMHKGSLSPTVSRSCGKDPPIAHTHLATVPNVVAERGKKRLFRTDAHQCCSSQGASKGKQGNC